MKLHKHLWQVQFQLFERLASTNSFEIEKEKPYDYKHEKNRVEEVKTFTRIRENFFSKVFKVSYEIFVTVWHDMIGLENFSLSFSQS